MGKNVRTGLTMTAAAVVAAVVWTAAAQTAGMLTDTRDGKTYKTAKIGGKTWMAQNLNYKTNSSLCYENNDKNCEKYGRLYDWNTAMTACPADWHLPSFEEWDYLCDLSNKKLFSTSGWYENGNGTDEYGFSALPGGVRSTDGIFRGAGKYGYWWTATNCKRGDAGDVRMEYDYDGALVDCGVKSCAFSVRCIKD